MYYIYLYILFHHQAHSFIYTFEHKINEEIMEEMKLEPADENLGRYESNCLQHVTRTKKGMPKILLDYTPNGRRQLGRLLERLSD